MLMDPYNDKGEFFSQATYASPAAFARFRSPWKLAVLLLIMALICFLLFQGYLAFPWHYLWFIGGDLMQPWFLVLLILGILYWRALPKARKQRAKIPLRQRIGALSVGVADGFGDISGSRRPQVSFSFLLRLPLVLLVGFLGYYFFFQGYMIRVNPHLTITSDCNVGSMTIEANATSNKAYMKAGLTAEGSGDFDQANNVLNLDGNACGLTVSVPADTNLHLSGNDAVLSVTGVTGKIELDDNAGNIMINGSTLLAGSAVTNNAGNITINGSTLSTGTVVSNNAGETDITNSILSPGVNVNSNDSPIHIVSSTINGINLSQGDFQIEKSILTGNIQLGSIPLTGTTLLPGCTLFNVTIDATQVGPVEFTNAVVKGFARIRSNGQAIGYAGTLTAGSSLTIMNSSGQETITLPSALAFHLDASGISSLNSNYAELQGLNPNALASSDGVHVDVGSHPQAIVAVQGKEEALTLNRG